MTNVFTKIAHHAKAHHDSVNAAYATYYAAGTGSSPRASTETPRHSVDAEATSVPQSHQESHESKVKRVAEEIYKRAKEHHKSVNAAYATYYGGGVAAV